LKANASVGSSENRSSNERREVSFRNDGRGSVETTSHAATPDASANAARTNGIAPDDEILPRGGNSPPVAVTYVIYPPVRRRAFLTYLVEKLDASGRQSEAKSRQTRADVLVCPGLRRHHASPIIPRRSCQLDKDVQSPADGHLTTAGGKRVKRPETR
jgi:hypothetical protein